MARKLRMAMAVCELAFEALVFVKKGKEYRFCAVYL